MLSRYMRYFHVHMRLGQALLALSDLLTSRYVDRKHRGPSSDPTRARCSGHQSQPRPLLLLPENQSMAVKRPLWHLDAVGLRVG